MCKTFMSYIADMRPKFSVNYRFFFQIPALQFNLKIETFDELCDPNKYPSIMSFFPSSCSSDIRHVSVLQMMDATRIPKCLSPRYFGPTITVEIKPKQGFMQNHPGINVPYCNNCVLQVFHLSNLITFV